MKSTSAKFKQIMAAATARKYLIKIDLTLADNTVLHLTEANIWEDSFSISTASSGTSSFDIGCAVIGKCTFTINNISGSFDSYDFFNANAVVWLGLEGDKTGSPATQQYYRMGFYTVDEPQKANGLISLELLDNMWKFDVPFSGVNITYPATALTVVQTLCTYCGVSLAASSSTFHGYNFSIAEAPKDTDNMNCREMLQYVAMLGCNFCTINDTGELVIKWYDVNATSSTTDVFEHNQSTSFGTEDIEITGVKFVIDNTDYTIGTGDYRLELENPLVTADNASTVLNLIWDVLDGFTLRTYNLTTASDLAAEIGDKCKIKDYKGNYIYSWITTNNFKFAGHQMQCNAETPNRTLVKRYSKTVQAAVEVARQQTNEILSNYDLDVQMMNDLAVNASGGFMDYEDLSTGGRVWYLSNMPITKVDNVCSFEANSTVFKSSGSGFFVSTDGGLTWTNGYNPQTGKLVVNVLSAIGIQFDWARGGTLTLGGYGNGNGELSIQNASNVEKVHGDNTGIKVGGTSGSKIHLTTDGELAYYYDNVYQGHILVEVPTGSNTAQLKITGFDEANFIADNEFIVGAPETHVSGTKTVVTGGVGTYADDEGIYLEGSIHPAYGYTAITDVVDTLEANGDLYRQQFANGMLVSRTLVSHNNLGFWHTWEVSDVTYDRINLSVGATTATFPSVSDDYAYEPFIQCTKGVSPPQITDMKITANNECVVTFTAVTSAQVGTDGCTIKLWSIRN